jgi:hypothetical protein
MKLEHDPRGYDGWEAAEDEHDRLDQLERAELRRAELRARRTGRLPQPSLVDALVPVVRPATRSREQRAAGRVASASRDGPGLGSDDDLDEHLLTVAGGRR